MRVIQSEGGVCYSLWLGQEYPWSTGLRMIRAESVERPQLVELRGGYDRFALAVPAKLWDLLHSGLGLRRNTVTCRKCGAVEHADGSSADSQAMRRLRFCGECVFWLRWAKFRRTDPNCVRIDGQHYYIAPDRPDPSQWGSGFGGARFTIRFHDGREVVSRNLWSNGRIPEHWRAFLPDNAEFTGPVVPDRPEHKRKGRSSRDGH